MSMSVEMILRLVDQATGPMRGVESELEKLQKTAEKLNAQRLNGGVKASVWLEQQSAIRHAREEAERYEKTMAKVNAAQSAAMSAVAARGFERAGDALFRAEIKAVEAARAHQRTVQSIATSGGLIGQEKHIGAGIMEASRASGAKWEDIAAGERQLVALGGGDFVEKIAGIRNRIARLHKASEAELPELYNAIYHYMELNKLSPEKAIAALEVNYLQGRKGAYELKDLARGIPSLTALAKSYGLTGEQSARDIPAILQVFRKITGTPGEADTRLRHILMKLTSKSEADKISEELGVNIFKTREKAITKGVNPLIATLDAIADRLDKLGPKAAEKLGAVARDFYVHAGLDAYKMMRSELHEYLPSADEARKAVDEAFAANSSTAAAAQERAANAWNAAAIKAATPWLEFDKKFAGVRERVAHSLGGFAEKNPMATAIAAGGGVVGLYATAGALARRMFVKGGEAFAEGAARAGAGAAAGSGLPIFGGLGLAGLLGATAVGIHQGILAGVRAIAPYSETAAHIAAQAAADHIRGGTETAASRAAYERAHAFAEGMRRDRWRKHPEDLFLQTRVEDEQRHGRRFGLSRFYGPEAPQALPEGYLPIGRRDTVPTFARIEGLAAGEQRAANSGPHVDTSDFHRAEQEAREAGAHIREALNVTASPSVETSAIERALGLARQLRRELEGIGAAATKAGTSAIRGFGSHALHDGPEAH
ncbi:MAG: phage tail tape measure protein [Methylocystaceae bacterium]|nr:MAG: phage tail tape measure protein [Methylocystaceae bacterium]